MPWHEQIAWRQPQRDLARAVVLPPREPGLGRAVGVQQAQIEGQVALDRLQPRRPAAVLRDQQERAVVDRIVDADAALDEEALGVEVNPFGQVRHVHACGRHIQVGEEPGGLGQRGGDDPAVVRRVEAAVHHPRHGAADELLDLAQTKRSSMSGHRPAPATRPSSITVQSCWTVKPVSGLES